MKQLSKVHSDEKSLVGNCLSFRKLPNICSSLMGTYFKTQLTLTHFIKSMFQGNKNSRKQEFEFTFLYTIYS